MNGQPIVDWDGDQEKRRLRLLEDSTPQSVLARSITKASSQQTYYTIYFLADRERMADAYCAYAYFRWVDDMVDEGLRSPSERIAFLQRQKLLLDRCYPGKPIQDSQAEEKMLIQLVQHDHEKNGGLQIYLRNMMKVMEFDAERRGRLISEAELDEYTCNLANAVTEALHYFIGHDCYSPMNESRYLAVRGAHIVHMLRDAYQDLVAGYYNAPAEMLEAAHIQPDDIQSHPYRVWVRKRVGLARQYFQAGKAYLAQVEEMRCRLAGFAYIARFEWLLDTIEREGYVLRPEYKERKRLGAKYQIGLLTFSSIMGSRSKHKVRRSSVSQ